MGRVALVRPLRSALARGGAGAALLSAALFGLTTPLAKVLLAGSGPLLTAGLLYLGSGLGLLAYVLIRERGRCRLGVPRADLSWLLAAIVMGGILAPALLMFGLSRADAASTSLLLNLESAFTAVIAWLVFREATSSRIVLGFLALFAGGVLLAWPARPGAGDQATALLAIVAACLCWGIDNNLTRKVSGGDARLIAAAKGLVSGVVNTGLALALGSHLPPAAGFAGTLAVGFLGYGVSLVLYVVALRNLGAARTGAYFATAPFIGAACSLLLFGQAGGLFWVAAVLMAAGVWLHLTEHHEHEHLHEPLQHSHEHVHDLHHRHEHGMDWDGSEPHTHEHRHEPLRHSHPHYPDLHHQHGH